MHYKSCCTRTTLYFYNEKLEKRKAVTCNKTNSFLTEERILKKNCQLGNIYIEEEEEEEE